MTVVNFKSGATQEPKRSVGVAIRLCCTRWCYQCIAMATTFNGQFAGVQIKLVFEKFCTNEGQLKSITTTRADKGKVCRWFMEHFLSFNYFNLNRGFYMVVNHVQLQRNSQVGKHICFSYCQCSWRMFMCQEKLWTFFPVSFCLRRYGMLNLCDLCNLLMSIRRKTLLYFNARRTYSRQIFSLWTSIVLYLKQLVLLSTRHYVYGMLCSIWCVVWCWRSFPCINSSITIIFNQFIPLY